MNNPTGDTPSRIQPVLDFYALTALAADMTTVTTTDGLYRYVSPASKRMFGWDPLQLQGHHQDEFVHSDDLPSVHAASRLPGSVITLTYRFRCGDGSYRWIEATSRQVREAGATYRVATVRDIAERQKSDVLLLQRASTDPLTGVANRTILMDRLRHALQRQGRGTGVLAVLFLDLDRFKVINDSLGHRVGDGALRAMAERLLRFLRVSDTLARLGGDEFVIVAEDVVDEEAAARLGERIVQAGRDPFQIGDEEFVCTVSVGVATTAHANYTPERLLQEADLALYRAKDLGRDRAEIFDEDLRTTAVGRLATERLVRRAITEGQLRVHYQPIIDLGNGRAVGAEALVRILDPQLGLLLPESFLEVSEETGLLTAIDEWVLTQAVDQATAWRARLGDGFSGVAVNITSRHLADVAFQRSVTDLLTEHDLPSDWLQFEVTERVLIEASNSAMTGLRALRDVGVQVGLDDFGTGYSSLAYLRQFPLNFVKIDKSFVQSLTHVPGEDAIVAAIIDLSHALGLTVVAEGVETPSQLETVTALGCDRAQGFLFARPGEPRVVEEYATSR